MMKRSVLLMVLAIAWQAQAENLTVISYGGTNKDAQDKAFYQPFMAAGKGTIEAGEYNGEMARIRAMVETGQIGWDLVEMETPELKRGCEEGLLETIDWHQLGEAKNLIPAAVSECGVGIFVWSIALTYNAKKLHKTPTSWADFWDVSTFPGKRALSKSAKYTLEIALMADGVKREEVYQVLSTPQGVDRAFRKLDQLKPYIQWWESGAQPLQWLISGDVVMSAAYSGRVAVAQDEGNDFKLVWNNALYAIDSWAIVKGSPHKKLAEQFMAFTLLPENQKVYAENIPYGPVNTQANSLLNADRLAKLPTAPANMAESLEVSGDFWLEHGEELEQRFNAWAAM